MPKLYESWPGNNRFLPCRWIFGPSSDSCYNLFVYGTFFSGIILYSIFLTSYIWQINPAISILFYIAVGLTFMFLLMTQFTDPGIIPRRPYLLREQSKHEKYLIQKVESQQAPINNSKTIKTKLCQTCAIYRPPKASHCGTCGNCVEVFDHHCPFVNNCIGKRNYRFFVSFIGSMMLSVVLLILNIFTFVFSIFGSGIDPTILIIICAIVVTLIGIPLLIFFIFHLYLIFKGVTTRELIKNVSQENTSHQWCWVDPPLIDYFEEITEEEKLQLQRKLSVQGPDSSIIEIMGRKKDQVHSQNDIRGNN